MDQKRQKLISELQAKRRAELEKKRLAIEEDQNKKREALRLVGHRVFVLFMLNMQSWSFHLCWSHFVIYMFVETTWSKVCCWILILLDNCRLKQESEDQHKADERARRDAILQRYLQRKAQQQEDDASGGPPSTTVSRRQKASRSSRPKSQPPPAVRNSALLNGLPSSQDDLSSDVCDHSSQSDMSMYYRSIFRRID